MGISCLCVYTYSQQKPIMFTIGNVGENKEIFWDYGQCASNSQQIENPQLHNCTILTILVLFLLKLL